MCAGRPKRPGVEMFAYGVDAPVAVQVLGAAPIALQE